MWRLNVHTILVLVVVAIAAPWPAWALTSDTEFCQKTLVEESCPINPPPPLPKQVPTDIIDVWYLQAPVFEGVFGDIFGLFGGIHSAIGFRNLETGRNYTAEYNAYFEVPNATFPHVVSNSTGQKDLIWCNKGLVCTLPYLNDTYWDPSHFNSARQTFVGTINGTLFNRLLPWILSYQQAYSHYVPWFLWSSPRGTVFRRSIDCDDFSYDLINALRGFGMQVSCDLIPAKRDFINLYTRSPPVPVSYAAEQADIIKYYEAFQFLNKKPLVSRQALGERLAEFDKSYFYDGYGQYYSIDLTFPFFGLEFMHSPLPGCPGADQCYNTFDCNPLKPRTLPITPMSDKPLYH